MKDSYRKIKVLSIVFVLLAVAAFFSLKKSSSVSTIDKETSVSIRDTALVYKISFEYMGKEQVLQRSQGLWKINGKYEARQRWANTILAGLNRLEVKRPVAEEYKNEVVNAMRQKGVKLNVFYGEQVMKYIMMPNDNDSNSTYLLANEDKTPYISYVPGIIGDISEPFRLSEQDWRTRRIFSASMMGLKEIRITYPADEAAGFTINFGGGGFSIKDVASIDTSKFAGFLEDLQYSPVLSYLSNKDSVIAVLAGSDPKAVIYVTDISEDRSSIVEIYKNKADKKTYLGLMGKEREPVLLRSDVFDRVLVKRDYFKRR
ncbi:MAG: hypothetical protein ACJ75J_03575 [Cytophagaceae bacterium]